MQLLGQVCVRVSLAAKTEDLALMPYLDIDFAPVREVMRRFTGYNVFPVEMKGKVGADNALCFPLRRWAGNKNHEFHVLIRLFCRPVSDDDVRHCEQEKRETLFCSSKSGHLEKPCRNEPRNNNPTLSYDELAQRRAAKRIYKQNERYLVSILLLNFPDFAFEDKAKNAFLIRDFSPNASKLGILTDKTTQLWSFLFLGT